MYPTYNELFYVEFILYRYQFHTGWDESRWMWKSLYIIMVVIVFSPSLNVQS
jgi:hypothetical protein